MLFPKKTQLNRIDGTYRTLPEAVYEPLSDLTVEAWVTSEPVTFEHRTDGEHRTLKIGESWGELWDCAWMHLTGSIPTAAAGKNVVLLVDVSGEGLLVDNDGAPLQGLTSVSSGFDFSLGKPGKRVIPFANPATGGETIDLWIDAAQNDLFGTLRNGGQLAGARVAIRRDEVQALCFDFEVLRELLDHLPPDRARHAKVLNALYRSAIALTLGPDDDAVRTARDILAPELAKRGGTPSIAISAIGHAHIDLAWLWPIRETIRKGARTFSTVLRMMDRYPDYVFGASQPQLYQWMKDHYPSLYDSIKRRVAEGRWEVQGAMWVEPDANIPSGEALVRQILYGKRFFRQEFGKDVTNLWMPDVFGYSGSIPQILRKAGVDTFLTQKLSWSQFNVHPHHTFHWVGIDGSSVLVHMPPEATYNSSAAPRAIAKAESDYLDKEVSDECLLLFGIGDGGGGPGEEHLERLAREKDLDGLAPVRQETSDRFFDRLRASADRYASWHGELYLERHQGTLTTQARNKRFNRKIEFALRELELAAVRAMPFGHPYPSEALDRIWKEVLLLQFHDILPGSSITRVFDESRERYAKLLDEVISLTIQADAALGAPDTESNWMNSLSWDRHEWVKQAGAWSYISAPALGSGKSAKPPKTELQASTELLENDLLRVEFAANGDIVRIFDKEAQRDILRASAVGNELLLFEDRGDAWDFSVDYAAIPPSRTELKAQVAEIDGPEAVLTQSRVFGASTIEQQIVLATGKKTLEFRTKVDWQERNKMLRVRFPVAVAPDQAHCEIQFGNIARSTHENTSWDWAKVEVCGHKWVDISERGYGVALLNDCKFGHRIIGGVLDLNLLRSPGYPDPVADQGSHEFTYALYPHIGDYAAGRVVRTAYELNVPLRRVPTAPTQLLTVSSRNVVVEAVKKAEDSDNIIIRMYEDRGASVVTQIELGFDVRSAAIVDLMEEHPKEVPLDGRKLEVAFQPFEIVTLKVTR